MSNKLYQYLGLASPKRGDVGLELEVEAVVGPLPAVNEKKWRTKEDGSLRWHAREYVTSEPVGAGDTLHGRIKYLTDKLQNPLIGVLPNSPRTSFHVHVNVTNLTPKQIWTAACAYWLFENVLVRHCDEGLGTREGNAFCLRLTDAEACLPRIKTDLKHHRFPFEKLNNDGIRNMGLNLSALARYGSLEIRTMRGSIDPDILTQWAQELNTLVNRSINFPSPANLMDTYYRDFGVVNRLLFTEQFQNIIRAIPDWRDLVEENIGILCEIAYVHDWDKWEAKLDKTVDFGPMRVPIPVEPEPFPDVEEPQPPIEAFDPFRARLNHDRNFQFQVRRHPINEDFR